MIDDYESSLSLPSARHRHRHQHCHRQSSQWANSYKYGTMPKPKQWRTQWIHKQQNFDRFIAENSLSTLFFASVEYIFPNLQQQCRKILFTNFCFWLIFMVCCCQCSQVRAWALCVCVGCTRPLLFSQKTKKKTNEWKPSTNFCSGLLLSFFFVFCHFFLVFSERNKIKIKKKHTQNQHHHKNRNVPRWIILNSICLWA